SALYSRSGVSARGQGPQLIKRALRISVKGRLDAVRTTDKIGVGQRIAREQQRGDGDDVRQPRTNSGTRRRQAPSGVGRNRHVFLDVASAVFAFDGGKHCSAIAVPWSQADPRGFQRSV